MSTQTENDLTFFEFDAITLHREDVEHSLKRSMTDEEWFHFVDIVAEKIDSVSWAAVEQVENFFKKLDAKK